jgi:hypothetical protein
MNNPFCPVCGHANRVGAAACEACDARLYEPAGADASEPFGEEREPFGYEREPSASASESSRAASDWTTSGPGGSDSWRPGEAIPAPPFKGMGDVISPMLAVYRKQFTLVGILVLVATVPEALLQYSVLSLTTAGDTLDAGVFGALSAGSIILWLLSQATAALLSGALVYAVVDVQRAGRASAGECLARGLKVLHKVFLVTLVYGVVTGIGFVLLVVPGVILSLIFAVCVPAAVIEGRGPIDAMKRSNTLTSGYKGLLFVTFFLWLVLIVVLNWLVTWSFADNGNIGLLPTLLLQTTVLGMLNSSLDVLTVYIYLGLLRERRPGFQTHTVTPGPESAAR